MDDPRNPYAPPEAAVADIVPATGAAFQPVKLFSIKGRIGRLRYFAYIFGAGFALIFVPSLIAVILGMLGLGMAARVIAVFGFVLTALYMFFGACATVQRAHDTNLSGWYALLAYIFPPSILFWIFTPGSKDTNRYGAPPPPNSVGTQVLFWISMALMVLVILGIVAANNDSFLGAHIGR
jgi:uncharacterized membrane protein YhaH (DUF805 family)